ncbi:MAG TPA: hypothetical protein DFS52_10510 [Myxococcales bacterium]|nr:hypothetical protein [Myxococcales bacterium]
MQTPFFELERVHRAAKEQNVRLTRKRCLDHLTPLLHGYERCLRFAAEVAGSLTLDDFSETVRMPSGEPFDVYGVKLSDGLAGKYGLTARRAWYLKLTVEDDGAGESVFYLSLHAPERPIYRNGGILVPEP